MNREPLFNTAAIVAVVSAALALLVSFGLGIDPGQVQAILTFVTVAAPFVVAYLARKKVTPVADPKNNDGNALTPDTETPVSNEASPDGLIDDA